MSKAINIDYSITESEALAAIKGFGLLVHEPKNGIMVFIFELDDVQYSVHFRTDMHGIPSKWAGCFESHSGNEIYTPRGVSKALIILAKAWTNYSIFID